MIIMGCINNKIKCPLLVFPIVLLGLVYLIAYAVVYPDIISYVYPPITIAVFALLMLENMPVLIVKEDSYLLNRGMLGYLLINFCLYLSRFPLCFQLVGEQLQYKGALPHTNMMGTVLLGILVILFWQNSKLAWINRVLTLFLILVTMSRTYTAAAIIIMMLYIMTNFWKKMNFFIKSFFIGGFLSIIIIKIFNLAIEYVSVLVRFKKFSMGGNGRQYLQSAYAKTINESTFLSKIFGIPLPRIYQQAIEVAFPHSFTENSYIGIFLLFGIVGSIISITILIKIFRNARSIQTTILITIFLLTMTVQDTLLSVQTGLLFLFSCIVATEQDPRKYTPRINGKHPLKEVERNINE